MFSHAMSACLPLPVGSAANPTRAWSPIGGARSRGGAASLPFASIDATRTAPASSLESVHASTTWPSIDAISTSISAVGLASTEIGGPATPSGPTMTTSMVPSTRSVPAGCVAGARTIAKAMPRGVWVALHASAFCTTTRGGLFSPADGIGLT